MSKPPEVSRNLGDYIEFLCPCGSEEELAAVFDGIDAECEECGRKFRATANVVEIRGPRSAGKATGDGS